jgi:Cu/Ag efflux pump CusA
MTRLTTVVSRELSKVPGVRNVSAHMGRAIASDKRTNINAGELSISLDPAADYDATVAAVRNVVADYEGLSPEVLTYLQARLREELSGTGESLSCASMARTFPSSARKRMRLRRFWPASMGSLALK